MDIRINPTSSAQINSVGTTPAIDPAEMKPTAKTTATEELSRDSANFSQFSGLVAKAMDQPEVRMDRVEAIKTQIAAGTYEINPSKVADAIISSALDNAI